MRTNSKVLTVFLIVLALAAQGTAFAEIMAPSCYIPVIGCPMQDCPMAVSMRHAGQKIDCCKTAPVKNFGSEALPAPDKNLAEASLSMTTPLSFHDSLDDVLTNGSAGSSDYVLPHDSAPLYEKNQDLRI